MKRLICLIVLLTSCCFGVEAQEEKEFKYKEIIAIAAIKDDKNCLFAGFPTFIAMRNIISDAESRFKPIVDIPTAFIYELFLADENGASATVFLGDHWISDGKQLSHLSDAVFSFLARVISARKFENENSRLESLTRDVNIATFKNELLKTQDYESIGRQPDDTNINKLDRPTPDLNKKIISVQKENIEKLKALATDESPSTSPASKTEDKLKIETAANIANNKKTTENPNTKKNQQDEIIFNEEKPPILALLIGLIIMVLFWRWMKNK